MGTVAGMNLMAVAPFLGMNFVAFLLVAAALLLGVIVAVIERKTPSGSAFLLGVGLFCVSLGVILQETFVTWSHSIHN